MAQGCSSLHPWTWPCTPTLGEGEEEPAAGCRALRLQSPCRPTPSACLPSPAHLPHPQASLTLLNRYLHRASVLEQRCDFLVWLGILTISKLTHKNPFYCIIVKFTEFLKVFFPLRIVQLCLLRDAHRGAFSRPRLPLSVGTGTEGQTVLQRAGGSPSPFKDPALFPSSAANWAEAPVSGGGLVSLRALISPLTPEFSLTHTIHPHVCLYIDLSILYFWRECPDEDRWTDHTLPPIFLSRGKVIWLQQ